MKYKVGDVVKVRSDLDVNKRYKRFYVTINMIEFKGKFVRIARVLNDCYNIYEDLKRWSWSDEMFEPFTEEDVKKHFEEYAKSFKDYDIKVEVKKKEPILDEEEKKYLSAVIKPFRYRVKYITKKDSVGYQYICVYVEHIAKEYGDDTVRLLFFKENTMYKRMVQNKEYTLEELGI